MRSEGELLSVIGQIYEAACSPARFAQLTAVLATAFDSESAIMCTRPTPSASPAHINLVSATSNFDAWAGAAYRDYFHARDEWFSRGIKTSVPGIVIGQELIDETAFSRTEFCTDWCSTIGIFQVLGVNLRVTDSMVGAIGVHRPRRTRRFDRADKRRMALLLPHLERAFQLRHRTAVAEHERDIAFDLIDRLGIGVMIVGADGRLLFANRVAERALRGGQGLSVSKGRLRAQDLRQQQHLERLFSEAANTGAGKGLGSGGVLSLPRAEGQPLTLLVAPFRSETAGYGPALPAAVVIFSDPANPAGVSEKALRSAYQLTRAQARLLAAVLSGQNLTEYAETARISINTAKTIMSQVLHKTGASRQAGLIRTITANPVFKLADQD